VDSRAGGDDELVGFKNLYQTTSKESKSVSVALVKKTSKELSFGVRTRDKTAKAPGDYKAFDRVLSMAGKDVEKVVQIDIVPRQELDQDLEFIVELYKVEGNARPQGEDAHATVAITASQQIPNGSGQSPNRQALGGGAPKINMMFDKINTLEQMIVHYEQQEKQKQREIQLSKHLQVKRSL
jgi:hypothetical protein